MDRSEGDPRVPGHDGFGAVAMMGVKIPDRDALGAARQRVERGHRDVIEKTKAHRLVASSVMSRRTH